MDNLCIFVLTGCYKARYLHRHHTLDSCCMQAHSLDSRPLQGAGVEASKLISFHMQPRFCGKIS